MINVRKRYINQAEAFLKRALATPNWCPPLTVTVHVDSSLAGKRFAVLERFRQSMDGAMLLSLCVLVGLGLIVH